MNQKVVKFGIIGAGLMGREFAIASLRWPALIGMKGKPQIIAVCDLNTDLLSWYENNFSTITQSTTDYKELLQNDEIEAIYCAVPHHLHEKIYSDIINAGKHLMGEKPFGIDKRANEEIMRAVKANSNILVRCSSEFPYYPGALRLQQYIIDNPWGQIIEVNAGFLHSSDLNPNKQINWKRMIKTNGEYGCMGDLGMHVLHIPLRHHWIPEMITSRLSKIIEHRPDAYGNMVPCETWDNAIIEGIVKDPNVRNEFPITFKTYRIAPGEMNTWFLEILGTKFSAKFSTKNPKRLEVMNYRPGEEQEWKSIDVGYSPLYKTITGSIFEFGFTDAMLQMWASFIDELINPAFDKRFGCIRPEETVLQHEILTKSLSFNRQG